MSYAHLDAPLRLGPISLGSRAFFLPEHLAHLDPAARRLPAQLRQLLQAAARNGFAAVGLGRFRHEAVASDTPASDLGYRPSAPRDLGDEEVLRSIAEVVGALPDDTPALATIDGAGDLPSALDRLAGAGVRIVEMVWQPIASDRIAATAAAAPPEIALGLRVDVGAEGEGLDAEAIRALLRSAPGIHFVHLAPSFERRLQMWGGSKRYPLIDDAVALMEGLDRRVIVSGRFKNGEEGDRAVRYHPVDAVGYTRAALADPSLLRQGRARGDWMPCTGCMACYPAPAMGDIGCAVNPWAGSDSAADLSTPDCKGVTVAVVGASLAALELARRVQQGGGEASVHRLGQALGGRVRLRGRIPQQAESAEAAMFMRRELDRLGVRVVADCAPELVDAADHVVLSLPERHLLPKRLARAAGGGRAVIDAPTLLAGGTHTPGPFAVVGDTLLAAETVAYLTMNGRRACLVSDGGVAADTHPAWAARYEAMLSHRGLPIVSAAAVTAGADGRWSVAGFADEVETLVAAGPPSVDPSLDVWRERWPHAHLLADPYEPWRQRAAMERVAKLLRFLAK